MERRLAAIMAVDVVGYSRLMGENEPATLIAVGATEKLRHRPRRCSARRARRQSNGRRLSHRIRECGRSRRMRGGNSGSGGRDFGEAGVRILELRIGVNVGDVMFEDGDVFGDGVNVAARLESLADPGGVLLSRAAYDQIRDKVQHKFEDLGERSLKNIVRPVQVHRLTRERRAQSGDRHPQADFGDLRAVAVLPSRI